MAPRGTKAEPNGWQHQAAQLAFRHTKVPMAAMTAAEQTRPQPSLKLVTAQSRAPGAKPELAQQTSEIAVARELEVTRAKRTAPEQLAARDAALAWILNARKETLAARAAATIERIAELEEELGCERERLDLLENENHSLATSLDLTVSENARLSGLLTARDAALDETRARLEQLKSALTGAETECDTLAAAANGANEKQLAEANALNALLSAMSARAVAAEALLDETRRSLLARAEENRAAERKLANAALARDRADKQLDQVQNSLELKERRIEELEQSCSRLIEGNKLRDMALARAREKIKLLAQLVPQLEAKVDVALSQEMTAEAGNSQPQGERTERNVAEGAPAKRVTADSLLQRELDNDKWLFAGGDPRAQ